MDSDGAEKAIVTSSLIVIAIYAYRRFTEQTTAPKASVKSVAGIGELPALGTFATAWTFTFFVCSIMAEVDPGLGGAFAILIATADFLTNGQSVLNDVITKTDPTTATAGKTTGSASQSKTTGATTSKGTSN